MTGTTSELQGIGVSRAALRAAFEARQVRFSDRIDKEKLRLTGVGRYGAIVELTGPEEELASATVKVINIQSQQATEWYNTYMLILLAVAAPDWDGAETWLANSRARLAAGESYIGVTQAKVQFHLTASQDLGLIVLKVEAAQ